MHTFVTGMCKGFYIADLVFWLYQSQACRAGKEAVDLGDTFELDIYTGMNQYE